MIIDLTDLAGLWMLDRGQSSWSTGSGTLLWGLGSNTKKIDQTFELTGSSSRTRVDKQIDLLIYVKYDLLQDGVQMTWVYLDLKFPLIWVDLETPRSPSLQQAVGGGLLTNSRDFGNPSIMVSDLNLLWRAKHSRVGSLRPRFS